MTSALCSTFGRTSSTALTTQTPTLRRARSLTNNLSLSTLVLSARSTLQSTAPRDASNKTGSRYISLSAQGRRERGTRFYSLKSRELRPRHPSSRKETTIARSPRSKSAWSRCSPPSRRKISSLSKVEKQPSEKGLMVKSSWLNTSLLEF